MTSQELFQSLEAKNEQYRGSDSILSISLLTCASHIDAPRTIMYNNAQKQRVVPIKPEKPYIFTNYEDTFGDRSSYIYKAKGDYHVEKIIKKFSQVESDVQPYVVFVYDYNRDMYDVIERYEVENLPEKYGFGYDNRVIDSLQEGDTVPVGTTLFTPTSYDEFGNYGYGKNVPFMYQISDYTLEDSIDVTRSLANEYVSNEVDVITVTLNDNNFLLNIMGGKGDYKCFPEVGEMIKDNRLCVRRVINYSQMLFDMKEPNTRKEFPTDKSVSTSGQVVDITVYCNKERHVLEDTEFNQQILRYLDMNIEYQTKIYEYTHELITEGHRVSTRIKELHKDALEYIDKSYKIRGESNKPFNHIVLVFTVKREVGLLKGQKLTGRYGNKGVIGHIREDHEAFFLENGRQIQIIFDALGVINRLNIFQLYEQAITFRAQRVLERIISTKRLKDKENLLFEFLSVFDPVEAKSVKEDYLNICTSTKEKRDYFQMVEKYGIYVHIAPFWRDKSLYDCLNECDEKFPWIEPYEIFFYNEASHRWVRQMTKQPVGFMYVEKLKQSSKKGLSVRSTGSVGKRGVPEKSDEAKRFHAPYSKIPVRLGVQEQQCQLISLDPIMIAKETMAHRSSPVARRELSKLQLREVGGVKDFKMTKRMTNRNMEILSAYLLIMGLELTFEEDRLDFSEAVGVKTHFYRNKTYFCTTEQMRNIVTRDRIREEMESANGTGPIYIGTEADRLEFIDEIAEKIAPSIEFYIQ